VHRPRRLHRANPAARARFEYDPVAVTGEPLREILSRNGVCPEVVAPPADLEGRERWLEKLQNGRRALVCPIRPSDVDRNARFIEELSPPSRHFLFLGGTAQLSDLALRRLCDPDYARDIAYVALAPSLRCTLVSIEPQLYRRR
jgi:hypothetical protein